MADIQFKVTVMEAEVGPTKYRLTLNPYYLGSDQWSLIKWPSDRAYTPGYAQILTNSGWQGVIARSSEVKYIDMQDVERYMI